MSNNPQFSFQDCRDIQKHLAQQAAAEGPTLEQAYAEAVRRVDAEQERQRRENGETVVTSATPGYHADDYGQFQKTVRPAWKPAESSAVSPVKCETHREKVHVFADGSRIASCSATDCMWGSGHEDNSQFRKRHSDGATFYPDFVEGDVDVADTRSPDDPEELDLTEKPVVAGEDDIDPDDEDATDDVVPRDASPDEIEIMMEASDGDIE